MGTVRTSLLRFCEAGADRLRGWHAAADRPVRADPAAVGGDIDHLAERGLQSLGYRTAIIARTVVVIVCGAFALPGAPEGGLPTAAAVAAALLGCGVYWLSMRDRRPRWPIADLVIVCGVCVSLHWTVAPEILGGGTGWVRSLASITVMAYQWHTRPLTGAGVAVVVSGAYAVGAVLSPEAAWSAVLPRAPYMLLEAALARGLWVLVRRGARNADELRRSEERVRMRGAVAAATYADEREYLAALHDTAAATLLMVGLAVTGGRQDWLSDQARRDVAILTSQVGDGSGHVDLVELLGSTIRGSPLDVAWIRDGPLWLPPGPANAISRGVHEALANVVSHAGVETATVRVERRDADVLVVVTDSGRGFVPGEVSPHQRGVSWSILERMAAAGGTASVTSEPGAGTCVRLAWSPTSDQVGPSSVLEEQRRTRSARVTVVGFLRGIRLSIFAIITALLLTWEVGMLVTHAAAYGSFAVQLIAYGALLLVAVIAGARVLRDRPMGRWGLPLMGVVFAAAVAAGSGVPAEAMGTPVHWVYGDVGWFGLLLLMESPLWVLIAVLAADYVIALAQLLAGGGAGLGLVAVLTTASVIIWVSQSAVALSTWTLRRVAEGAARTALEEERLRTQEAVGRRIHRDRQARYAALKTKVVPLLNGLASGELDPGDQRVRHACAVEAARLRRLFAERDDVPDRLVHELQACIDAAERRGITVSLAIRGRTPALRRDVRRALTEPTLAALMTAATTARVTVVASPSATTVSVVADSHKEAVESTVLNRIDQVAVSVMTAGERLWVEATWRESSRSR